MPWPYRLFCTEYKCKNSSYKLCFVLSKQLICWDLVDCTFVIIFLQVILNKYYIFVFCQIDARVGCKGYSNYAWFISMHFFMMLFIFSWLECMSEHLFSDACSYALFVSVIMFLFFCCNLELFLACVFALGDCYSKMDSVCSRIFDIFGCSRNCGSFLYS